MGQLAILKIFARRVTPKICSTLQKKMVKKLYTWEITGELLVYSCNVLQILSVTRLAKFFQYCQLTQNQPNLKLCFTKIAKHLTELYRMTLRLFCLWRKLIMFYIQHQSRPVPNFEIAFSWCLNASDERTRLSRRARVAVSLFWTFWVSKSKKFKNEKSRPVPNFETAFSWCLNASDERTRLSGRARVAVSLTYSHVTEPSTRLIGIKDLE